MESNKSSLQNSDLEKLQFLVSDLWGPSSENQIHQFANIPFQPFNRSKINLAPFNQELNNTQRKHVPIHQQINVQQQQYHQLQKEKQSQLNVTEDGFNEVQVKQVVKQKPHQQFQRKNNKLNQKLYNEESMPNQVKVHVKKVRKKKFKNPNAGYQRTKYVQFKDSVLVKSSFEPLCEVDKSIYEKTIIKEVLLEEIKRTGKLKEFSWTYNNIHNKKPTDMPASTYVKQLKVIDSNAQRDPCLLEILQENVDREEELQKQYEELQEKLANRKNARQERRKAMNEGQQVEEESDDDKVKDEEPPTMYKNVYITDALLNGLLTLKNSEFPWDIKIYKENNTYFFDKYNEENVSYLDLDTMNENSTQKNVLPTDESEVQNICRETTSVRNTLIKNATAKGAEWEYIPEAAEEEEEGEEGEEQEQPEYTPNYVESVKDDPVAFRYVKVTIDNQIQVFVRAKIDAYETTGNNKKVPIICKAFTEYNPIKFDWRKKMNLSVGALTSELQIFNLCELNKALMQMYLTDSQRIKLAYVSRDLRDINKSDKHSILKVDSYTYEELRHELKVDPQESWQIIKYLINYLSKLEDGSYLLLKHSYKSSLNVYALPEGYDKPESSDDELGEEDEEEGEDDGEDEDEEQ